MNALAMLMLLACAAPTSTDQATNDTVLVLELAPVGMSSSSSKAIDALVSVAATRRLKTVPAAQRPVLHTSDDLRTLGDVGARRSLAGCDEDSTACLVEIAGALGARYVLAGTAATLGEATMVQLVLVDTQASKPIARSVAQIERAADLEAAVGVAVEEVLLPLAPRTTSGASVGLVAGTAVTALGVLAGGVGGFAVAVFDGRLSATSEATDDEKQQALDLGLPAVGLTAAGLLTAVVGACVVVVSVLTAETP